MIKANNLYIIFSLIFLVSLFMIPSFAIAEEEAVTTNKEDEVAKEPLMYYPITPNTLTFYQGTGKRIGYVVVQVQIVIRGQKNLDLLDANLPLIQDALTDYFNRQDKKNIEDLSLRESLRQGAKEKISEVMTEEIGTDIIENVLFTQYIFQ